MCVCVFDTTVQEQSVKNTHRGANITTRVRHGDKKGQTNRLERASTSESLRGELSCTLPLRSPRISNARHHSLAHKGTISSMDSCVRAEHCKNSATGRPRSRISSITCIQQQQRPRQREYTPSSGRKEECSNIQEEGSRAWFGRKGWEGNKPLSQRHCEGAHHTSCPGPEQRCDSCSWRRQYSPSTDRGPATGRLHTATHTLQTHSNPGTGLGA